MAYVLATSYLSYTLLFQTSPPLWQEADVLLMLIV